MSQALQPHIGFIKRQYTLIPSPYTRKKKQLERSQKKKVSKLEAEKYRRLCNKRITCAAKDIAAAEKGIPCTEQHLIELVMENQPFLLVELEDLSCIFTALKTTSRIKYTCFNASNNYLIFGATSGGLYVFRREPCCFLQILPNKEGSVTQVAISPDEKLIAFSTVKGLVCILEKSTHGAKHFMTTSEHQNEQVTCLQWNEGSNELFIGDSSGKVSIVTVSIFPTKSMFQNPSFVLMQLESKIVQMDFSSNMLLVSTLTKCYICDTAKEIFRQVGHKLRDGEYGACIFNTQNNNEVALDSSRVESDRNTEYPNLSHLKLLCARPGSRIWEVAIDGTVISTHHFKEALAVPPRKIHFLNSLVHQGNDSNYSILSNGTCEQINSNAAEQSFNFQKLYNIMPKFFLTYKSDGIYVFDPQKASVVLWNNEITNIVDVKCVNDVIYVWSGYGKMYALNLVPLEKFLVRLYFQKKYLELAKLCLEHESFLLSQANNCSKLHFLHDLDEKLKSDELHDRLKPLINLCKEGAQKRKNQNAQKLQSGIYLVNNNDQAVLEGRRTTYQKYLRPSYLNLKGRSHSVSPERLQNGGLRHQGSCSSLPDLAKDEKIEESCSPQSEIVVNGRRIKEAKAACSKPDTESVLKILAVVRKSPEPSSEIAFNLFEQILELSDCKDLESSHNLELVHLLPFNSYFNKEDENLISRLFNSALKSGSLFEWLSKFTGNWLLKGVEKYPNFLIEHHSPEDLELDYKLSKTLKLFSSAINEHEIIELIKSTGMKCYYACLNEILDVYHDSSVSDINLANVMSTPKLLNRVFFLMNVGQIEQCSRYAYKIDLKDMFYLMLKCEQRSTVSGKPADLIELQCHTAFLSYLDKASEENKLIANCGDIIETYVISCLENIISTASRVKESNCSCGFPSPNLQPSIAMFSNVGHALLDKNWPKNPEKCMEICGRVPYLWRYLVFLRRNDPLLSVLPLLLQTGEVQELETRSNEMNETILETYLKHLIKLKNGTCLNCGKDLEVNGSVSWAEFGTLCVKLLGPMETLELYRKYSSDINSKELHQTFYQTLIFSAIMERHSKGLRKNVVDLLAGRGSEECNRMSIFSDRLSEQIFGKSSSSELGFQNAKYSSHHWGAKVNFKNNCAVCSLPLETKVLISEAGLVVFKCAHVFHSACLRKAKLECPVCKKKPEEGEKC